MKFVFRGTIDEFVEKYSVARDNFNKENPSKSFALVAYLRAGYIEIGIEKGTTGGAYWFKAPVMEKDGCITLEGDILPDSDMRMRWYDWILFGLISVVTCIPMLLACIFTKSTPFGTKKKREARLTSYLCDYLGCERAD